MSASATSTWWACAARRDTAAALVVCGLAVGTTTAYAYHKYLALAYGHRDFLFYAQFQARLLDPGLSARYVVNPHGVNFLTFSGMEGDRSLHQSVHFEPVKYVEAVAFRVAGLVGSFATHAILFFIPVVYLLNRAPTSQPWDRPFRWLVASVYCLYPSVLLLLSWDLRPWALLLPFFTLGFLALHVRTRPVEAVTLFNLTFLAREEALVLSPVLIFYALTCARGDAAPHYRGIVRALVLSWIVWVCVTLGFFAWTGYEHDNLKGRLGQVAAFVAAGSAMAAVLRRAPDRFASWTRPLALCLVLVPLAMGLWEYYARWPDLRGWLYAPRLTIFAGFVLLLFVPVWDAARARWVKLALLAGLGVMAVGAVVAHAWPTRISAYRTYRANRAALRDGRIVFALRAHADRIRSVVLTDRDANQAFFDFENLYVLGERPMLAWSRPRDATLLPRVEYIAVSLWNVDSALRAVHALGAPARIAVLEVNPRFITYRVVW